MKFSNLRSQKILMNSYYLWVQMCHFAIMEKQQLFLELVKKDPLISRKLRGSEIHACFDPRVYIKHLPKVYRRVFGSIPTPKKPKFKVIHKKGRR